MSSWEEMNAALISAFNDKFVQEFKERMQGAYEVLTGKSVAVDWKLVEEMAFSHSIMETNLEEERWEQLDDVLAELPQESRTPEMEKQVIDSFNKEWWGMGSEKKLETLEKADNLLIKAHQINQRAQQSSAPEPERDRDIEPDL